MKELRIRLLTEKELVPLKSITEGLVVIEESKEKSMKKIVVDHVPSRLANFEPRYGMAYRVDEEYPHHWILVGKDEQGLFYRETDSSNSLISQKYSPECSEYDFSDILHHF